MPFTLLTKEQEKLLFFILDARDKGELDSDAFIVFDMGTFQGRRVQLGGNTKALDLVDTGITDLLPLSHAGYLKLELVREADHFRDRDQTTWHGAILEHARAYRRWRRRPGIARVLAPLVPTSGDVRRVIYSGAVAALLVQAWNNAIAPSLATWMHAMRFR